MNDVYREETAKLLLSAFRNIWCDRESDEEPYFNCGVCEFEDGEECRLKHFIKNAKYETVYPQGMIEGGDSE